MQIVTIIILLLYMYLILRYTVGWLQINSTSLENFTPKVSIVIAVRNEEDEVERLINNLELQSYPNDKLEFIIVNDHSEDNTLMLLNDLKIENLTVVNMPSGSFGKKNAILKAVEVASGEIVLATDADCSFNHNWVQIMVSYFKDERIKLVSGPVNFHQKNGIFHNLQVLEFISLVASGAGSIASGNAIFCNGANMAYRKDVFLEVNNFKHETTISGDDVFLLHNVKKKYPNSIVFAKVKDAIVNTSPAQTLGSFVNQRKRWTAKTSSYEDCASLYTSFLVFFTNLCFLLLLIMSFSNLQYFKLFCSFYLIKFVVDLSLLYPALKFFSRLDIIKWIFPFELFYSIYIILIVIFSFVKSFEWKGRTYVK